MFTGMRWSSNLPLRGAAATYSLENAEVEEWGAVGDDAPDGPIDLRLRPVRFRLAAGRRASWRSRLLRAVLLLLEHLQHRARMPAGATGDAVATAVQRGRDADGGCALIVELQQSA